MSDEEKKTDPEIDWSKLSNADFKRAEKQYLKNVSKKQPYTPIEPLEPRLSDLEFEKAKKAKFREITENARTRKANDV